jgi:hypothetical protein
MKRGVADSAPVIQQRARIQIFARSRDYDQGLLGFLSSLSSTALPILMVAPKRL